MVGAAVPERKLERLEPEREPEDLVAQADAEQRHLSEQVTDRFDRTVEHRRVARAVADEDGARAGSAKTPCIAPTFCSA